MTLDITPSLYAKGFFRFTGPPEHWLTAIKFMTWGLEEKYKDRWERIQPGDIFFIHSTKDSNFDNAKSGIIGLGVVGSNFSIKNNLLWLREQQEQSNIWPLLVPLSEIYIFSPLPDKDTWENPDPSNVTETSKLIDLLLKNLIPISSIKGFPWMGSFSSVSQDVAKQIISDKRSLYEFESSEQGNIVTSKPTKFEPIKSASEALRYSETLEVFDSVKARVVRETTGHYTKDNELLARAEDVHSTILQNLIDIFKSKGYETLSNKFVDLFAHNEDRSFLFDVKSTENRNFRSQARKGLVQLFEYDYFDVNRYTTENNLKFSDKYKIIVPSQNPEDRGYISFINFMKVGVATVDNQALKPVGTDFGFSKI